MLESFHRRCLRFLTEDNITKLPESKNDKMGDNLMMRHEPTGGHHLKYFHSFDEMTNGGKVFTEDLSNVNVDRFNLSEDEVKAREKYEAIVIQLRTRTRTRSRTILSLCRKSKYFSSESWRHVWSFSPR